MHQSREVHFDIKLKLDNIPSWDGDPDTLAKWILKINTISEESTTVFTQLGHLVPKRLERDADSWFLLGIWDIICKSSIHKYN